MYTKSFHDDLSFQYQSFLLLRECDAYVTYIYAVIRKTLLKRQNLCRCPGSRTVPLENNDGSREIIFSVNFFSWFQDRTGDHQYIP